MDSLKYYAMFGYKVKYEDFIHDTAAFNISAAASVDEKVATTNTAPSVNEKVVNTDDISYEKIANINNRFGNNCLLQIDGFTFYQTYPDEKNDESLWLVWGVYIGTLDKNNFDQYFVKYQQGKAKLTNTALLAKQQAKMKIHNTRISEVKCFNGLEAEFHIIKIQDE